MITAVHTLIYCDDPEAARTFFRDVLAFPHVDTGGGWLIFQTGPSELGAHPDKWEHEGTAGRTDQRFDVSFMCDDLESTMGELSARGAEFVGAPTDEGWGGNHRDQGSRRRGDHVVRAEVPTAGPPVTVRDRSCSDAHSVA